MNSPVEMFLDVHFQFVCHSTVQHMTNIHHVYVLMSLHHVRSLRVNNPKQNKTKE